MDQLREIHPIENTPPYKVFPWLLFWTKYCWKEEKNAEEEHEEVTEITEGTSLLAKKIGKTLKKKVKVKEGILTPKELSKEEKEKVKSEGILANSVETKPSSLQVRELA